MPHEQAIKRFVQTVLGCTCPESVFEHIEKRRQVQPTREHPYTLRLVIGDRLLIYMLEDAQIKVGNLLLENLFIAGRRERDTQGYNRFRAVLIDNVADAETEAALQAEWQRLAAGDERVHLHLVHPDSVARVVDA